MEPTKEHLEALARAKLALTGLAIGDAIGGFFEFSHGKVSQAIKERKLPGGIWHWTDDTQMALSVFSVLRQHGEFDQDLFASSLASHYERSRGYGMTMRSVIQRIKQNKSWHKQSEELFRGEGSFGNGAASRVPPLGAFYAGDISEVIRQAESSAEVTHAHPESIAGTIAVAITTALAWQFRTETDITRQEFLERMIPHIPQSIIRDKLILARDLGDSISVEEAVHILGNGQNATVQTTVPFALWCAADCRQTYVDAIWCALEGQGDCDTVCAIVGGVTAMRVGDIEIPESWQQACEPLSEWAFEEQI